MAALAGQGSSAADRVRVAPVEGADTLFTPAFLAYLVRMHDAFTPRAHALRAERDRVLRRALEQGIMPGPAPEAARAAGDWKVPPVPEDLRKPGIEISGPCSITSMFINALNPGPEGERAEGDLDDDEDSAGHRLVDTVRACHNRLAAVNRELGVRRPRAQSRVQDRRRRAALLHASRARTAPRRARGDGGRRADPRRRPRHRAHALLPGRAPRPTAARASTSICPSSRARRSARGTATSSTRAARRCPS